MEERTTDQLDIFGGRHPRRPRLRTVSTWQPGLFTAEHEARANAADWEAALEQFRQAARGDDEPPAVGRYDD